MDYSDWCNEIADILRSHFDLGEDEAITIVLAYGDLYDEGYEVDDAAEEIEREEGLL